MQSSIEVATIRTSRIALSLDSVRTIYNNWNARGLLLNMAQIALFVGSVRRDRQGIKVARWMKEKLIIRGHAVYFIDPLN